MAMRRSFFKKRRQWPRSTASSWWNRRWKRFLSKTWEARPMRSLLLVARREYLEQIRGRAFKVTTILVPALFGLVLVIMYLAGRGASGAKHIVIASNDAGLATDIREQLNAHNDSKSQFDVQAIVLPGDRAPLV